MEIFDNSALPALTKALIEGTPAGPLLDQLVAAYVMGFGSHVVENDEGALHLYKAWLKGDSPVAPEAKAFSTTPALALDVFFKAVAALGSARLDADMETYGRGAFTSNGASGDVWVHVGEWSYCAPFPEAVCKAALLACVVE